MAVNPVALELYKNRFSSIAEEMGTVLNRTAFSPNIKERRDYSCALFNAGGEMVAQAAHIPVHLGAMPLSVTAAIQVGTMEKGDMVILNDPYNGGTHLPDITIVAPVFLDENAPSFYVANRAHHADVGGASSGSMPLADSIFQEGLIVPPVKLVKGDRWNRDVLQVIRHNVRTPWEREGDLAAQVMANKTGMDRLRELVLKYGKKQVLDYAEHLMDYSETMMRRSIAAIPDGKYRFSDYLEDDGHGFQDLLLQATVTIGGDSVVVDFSGSSPQTAGGINAVYAVTLSSVLYVFQSLMPGGVPPNSGCRRPIRVVTEKGSLVDAVFPAAVAGGNVETSQRIVDVLLGALFPAIPEQVPAASQGTMNNIAIGGMDERTGLPFAYYETIGGGMGAGFSGRGECAVHSHMTNTLNTPIEALEFSYPLRVARYAIRRGSGGVGLYGGGDGIVREIELLSPAEATVISERRLRRPYGLAGGAAGQSGRNLLWKNGRWEEVGGKFHRSLAAGDRIHIETPGGGGYGKCSKKQQ